MARCCSQQEVSTMRALAIAVHESGGHRHCRCLVGGVGRVARKPPAPVEGLRWSGCRHQASSSPQGDVRPCLSGCRLQTTYDGTWIMGFAIGEEHDALALLFENRGGRIFSAMLWPHNGLLLCARNKGGDLSRIYTAPDRLLRILGRRGTPLAQCRKLALTRCSSFFALTDFARHEPKQNPRIARD